jgi:hypothetical protein
MEVNFAVFVLPQPDVEAGEQVLALFAHPHLPQRVPIL